MTEASDTLPARRRRAAKPTLPTADTDPAVRAMLDQALQDQTLQDQTLQDAGVRDPVEGGSGPSSADAGQDTLSQGRPTQDRPARGASSQDRSTTSRRSRGGTSTRRTGGAKNAATAAVDSGSAPIEGAPTQGAPTQGTPANAPSANAKPAARRGARASATRAQPASVDGSAKPAGRRRRSADVAVGTDAAEAPIPVAALATAATPASDTAAPSIQSPESSATPAVAVSLAQAGNAPDADAGIIPAGVVDIAITGTSTDAMSVGPTRSSPTVDGVVRDTSTSAVADTVVDDDAPQGHGDPHDDPGGSHHDAPHDRDAPSDAAAGGHDGDGGDDDGDAPATVAPSAQHHWVYGALLVFVLALGFGLWGVWTRWFSGDDTVGTAELQRRNDRLSQEIATLRRSDQISRDANRDLQRTLAERDEEIAGLRADVAFYERFVGATGQRRGLSVHDLEMKLQGGNVWRFVATLTQNVNRGAVNNGRVTLAIEGTRNDRLEKLNWSGLRKQNGAPGLGYSFKYFQQVEGEVMLPAGFKPLRVQVRLTPEGGNTVEQSFPWPDVVRGMPGG